MLQNLPRLENSIRESRDTDVELANWWLVMLVLSWLTLGIYPIIVFIKRISRRDRHFARVKDVLRAAYDCTREIADTKKADLQGELVNIESKLELASSQDGILRRHGAGFWFLISILTFGFGAIYVWYFHTKDWYGLQRFEKEIMDDFSRVWTQLGIVKYPVNVEITAKDRSFGLYLILHFVTFGIWAIIWDYIIHTEPLVVFKESQNWEQTILNAFRQL